MRSIRHCVPVLAATPLVTSSAQASTDPICGRWQTDEEGVVHVYVDAPDSDGKLAFRIGVFSAPNERDDKSPDPT
jgi:hypothetical protein